MLLGSSYKIQSFKKYCFLDLLRGFNKMSRIITKNKKLIVLPLSYKRNDLHEVAQGILTGHPHLSSFNIEPAQEIPNCFYHYETPGLESFLNKFNFSMWLYCDLVPKQTDDVYLAATSIPICDEESVISEGFGGLDYHIAIISTESVEKEKPEVAVRATTALGLHEAGHCSGLKDHKKPVRVGQYFCPMGAGYPAKLDGTEYCSSCLEQL